MGDKNLVSIDYTSLGGIKKHWTEKIAPNYFGFDNINNYQTGIFGYINEVMAEAVEDGFNAITTARREFYPVTARYASSFYKMATLQQIDLPMTTPAIAKVGLIIPQNEIISNSTFSNGLYTCVIDSCLKIMADNLQFMLDYPIVILSKKTANGYSHTIHYDITTMNSLNTKSGVRYISNKIIKDSGVNYLVLFLDTVRQVEMTQVPNVIIKDSILETTSVDVDFDGNLANFEVFYIANQNAPEIQLKKVLLNGSIPNEPFVYYELVNQNKIRLTFPSNVIFTPEFNSEILTRVYTSEGSSGNMDSFNGSLVCSSDSEKYPYNSTMTITGIVNGSAIGGLDQPSLDEFRSQIIQAYSTNNTITSANDLQSYFDNIAGTIKNLKILFRKKRDDALIRLFGAYALLKDENNDVVPTNTLDLEFLRSEIMSLDSNETRLMIKPGTIFEYIDQPSEKNFKIKISEDQSPTVVPNPGLGPKHFKFTCPFLIGLNINPTLVGYYMNSVDVTKTIEYTYVNDETPYQFIANNLKVDRNAMVGENYYRFSISLSPASSDMEIATIATANDPEAEENIIRATQNGKIISKKYVYRDNRGFVEATIEYDDETTITIECSNSMDLNGTRYTGYDLLFEVGETFVAEDILATKKATDLGKLRALANINVLYSNGKYIPFVLEHIDEKMKSFEFNAYLSTDDLIDLNGQLVISHGIYNRNGTEDDNIAIPMKDQVVEIHVFYKNDTTNLEHKYSNFEFAKGLTLTNTYISTESDPISFVEEISFVRSVLDFAPGQSAENFKITISEVPVVGSEWAANTENYKYLIRRMNDVVDKLQLAYYFLENNFAIDLKFYNSYGKARFYSVGITKDLVPLTSVSCRFRFGVNLVTLSSTDVFIEKFRNFVKNYIESTDNVTSTGHDIYILNMTSALKEEFTEIGYLEYYGFNEYGVNSQKIIGPDPSTFMKSFIPEFINVDTDYDADGIPFPAVSVDILEQ